MKRHVPLRTCVACRTQRPKRELVRVGRAPAPGPLTMPTVLEQKPNRPGWPGVIEAYRERLPVSAATPVVTLHEGGTALVPAPRVAEAAGIPQARVYLKFEGLNPTGSFK